LSSSCDCISVFPLISKLIKFVVPYPMSCTQVRIAQAYEKGGAACLSVLTDSKYFQGSFENLALIHAAGIQCPLLCKEFIIDAWQIYKARVSGADAVLLIAAVLPDQDLTYMTKIAKALGMAALIEVGDYVVNVVSLFQRILFLLFFLCDLA
jgi:indole-3-glycerol phosphate synthase